MRLILHIGTEKTGTTAVQSFMHENRSGYSDLGVLYPCSAGEISHIKLAAYALNDDNLDDDLRQYLGVTDRESLATFRKDLRRDLMAEVEQANPSVIVLSNEHCSSRLLTEDAVFRLKDLISPICHEIHIIIYLSRQDEFLIRTYSTQVKYGYKDALKIPGKQEIIERYDYEILIKRWASVFGSKNIRVFIYDRSSLEGGDIIQDFIRRSGLPVLDKPRKVFQQNESLDIYTLEFLRRFNSLVPLGDPNRGEVVSHLERISDSSNPRITLPDKHLDRLMERVRVSNERVAEAFFSGPRATGDPLFGPLARPRNRSAAQGKLSADQCLQIAAGLWTRKEEEHRAVLRGELEAGAETERRYLEEIAELRGELDAAAKAERGRLEEIAALRSELDAAAKMERGHLEEITALRGELAGAAETERGHIEEIAALRSELQAMLEHVRSLEGQVHALYTSTSWRITRPLRVAPRLLRREVTWGGFGGQVARTFFHPLPLSPSQKATLRRGMRKVFGRAP